VREYIEVYGDFMKIKEKLAPFKNLDFNSLSKD
jgi:hypothetical protein